MADEVKTKEQLVAEMKAAIDEGKNWKAIGKLSGEIDRVVKAEAQAEKDTRVAELVGITDKTRKAVIKVVKALVDSKELDICDGIWFAWDFGNKEELGINPSCRLIKPERKLSSGGGGGGKKFAITTPELLAKHNTKLMPNSDRTFQQAYDEAQKKETKERGNAVYKVRMKLLKADGLT